MSSIDDVFPHLFGGKGFLGPLLLAGEPGNAGDVVTQAYLGGGSVFQPCHALFPR